ncbi:hypothetical protein [Cryobacterium sp. Y11]|uniref:hypothetical protein n=1 Tax=Cryobacterium sp. Y11 TaxID=2045016 RepID=UPI000CE4961C|nr:hypothetical protein [Cryobacterium sp. Y11]
MGYIDDASGKRDRQNLWAAVRKLGTMSPLDNSSVEGRTRFIGNESLLVEGSQKVTGWLIVTGTLKVVGAFLLEGVTTITGALTSSGTALFTGLFTARGTTRFEGDTTQVGAHHVQGNQDITGTLAVKGATEVSADLSIVAGGIIKVGSGLTLEPLGAGGGAINFLPSGSISAGLGKFTLVSPDLSAILTLGGGGVTVTLPLKSGAAVNVHVDGNGKLWRTS